MNRQFSSICALSFASARNAFAIREQQPPGLRPVQFKSEDSQVALVLLLPAGKLANEDVILVDDVDARSPENAEPLPAIYPSFGQIMGLNQAGSQAESRGNLPQNGPRRANLIGNFVDEIDIACRPRGQPLDQRRIRSRNIDLDWSLKRAAEQLEYLPELRRIDGFHQTPLDAGKAGFAQVFVQDGADLPIGGTCGDPPRETP
jgi:hypothetical protein